MNISPELIISGLTYGTDLFFKLKGIKSKKEKMLLSINKIFTSLETIAINLSITNLGEKPFSIIEIYIEQSKVKYYGSPIIEKNIEFDSTGTGIMVTLVSDTMKCFFQLFEKNDNYNLNSFDLNAFLQPNQSETGWLIFPIDSNNKKIDSISVKISGESEYFINL